MEAEKRWPRLFKHGLNESLGSCSFVGKVFLEKKEVLALSAAACVFNLSNFVDSWRVFRTRSFGVSVLVKFNEPIAVENESSSNHILLIPIA